MYVMLYHYVKDTNAREEKITCLHCCKLVRVPICREIEVELQLWRGGCNTEDRKKPHV